MKKKSQYPNRFKFPTFLLTNAESLNFDKITELEGISKIHKINIIAVTEVQSQNPDFLKISNYTQFIKLRPPDHPLGKKGGGILFFVRDNLQPKLIPTPNLSDYDEILWLSLRPKVLPRPFNLIVTAVFYHSPNQSIDQKRKFIQQFLISADFVLSKYPNAGICLLGDANDLRIDSICTSLNIKQLVKISTTKGNTSLDVICSNMSKYYNSPQALPPLGGSYHYCLLFSPSSAIEHSFTTSIGVCRPLSDTGLFSFGSWLTSESWSDLYNSNNLDDKILIFHKKLIDSYSLCFPEKKKSESAPVINLT